MATLSATTNDDPSTTTSNTTSSNTIVPGIPHSKVINLTETNFETMITDPANGLWFLKFYAPWCGHCQQLAPVLHDIAEYLRGKMAIGKIDCTVERKLCSKFNVDGYPTLKIYRDGSYFDYPGKRDHDSIITFGEKMSSYSIQIAYSYDEMIQSYVSKSDTGVVFVAYDGTATDDREEEGTGIPASTTTTLPTSTGVERFIQSTPTLQVFGQVARMMQAYADFVLLHPTTTSIIDLERFGISQHGSKKDIFFIAQVQIDTDPLLYSISSSSSSTPSLNTTSLLDFVKTYNLPLVTPIDSSNFRFISRKGKPLAIAIVYPDDNTAISQEYILKWKEYAKTGPKDILNQYIFTSIDGKKWNGFLKQFSINTSTLLPQLLILDVPHRKYWYDDTSSSIIPMRIDEFMFKVTKGEIPYRIQTNAENKVLARIEEFMWLYAPYSFVLAILVLAGVVYLLTMSCFEEHDVVVDPMKKDN